MQLSQKQKSVTEFFAGFLKSNSNFEHFDQKDDPDRPYISEITYSENVVR